MLPGETDLFDILFIIKVCIGKVMSQHIKWHKPAEYPRDTTPPSEINAKIYIWNYTQITLRKQFERRRKKERKKKRKRQHSMLSSSQSAKQLLSLFGWLS